MSQSYHPAQPSSHQQPAPNPINEIKNLIQKDPQSFAQCVSSSNLYLPRGWSYQIASSLFGNPYQKGIETHQLRKIFAMVQEAESKEDFEESKKQLYAIVPMLAYATGRKLIPTPFYNLLEKCITPDKIKSKEDIKVFAQFFENIIAYSKYIKENR